ncbi:hypothetical protein SCHPADRAFT_823746 [Schizopora paradoxa]|uniref:Cora-domain-containing protein n=1 Tax=Schizopora paradoxa TaxID=27342 RepID=A0A0H2RWN6_9AGAM|nr:hypothetical protein SCHPADRAFT_823746 [Schizopora paradoxa]
MIVPSRSRAQTAQTFASRASGRSAISSRPGAGIERFRAAARKIIHMHRGSRAMTLDLNTGAEPGIDARNADADSLYGHIRARCLIDVVDYSSVRSKFQRFDNMGFLDYLEDERANRRDEWAKVRWINVVGISWDVMSALAIKYDIHPLALEDIIHGQSKKSRSKADYYAKHLFIRILRHTLAREDSDDTHKEPDPHILSSFYRSQSPSSISVETYSDDEGPMKGSQFNARRNGEDLNDAHDESRVPSRGRTSSTLRMQNQLANEITLEDLKSGDRVKVDVLPFFICLFRDGTVVSFSAGNEDDFVLPISARLRRRDTGLRATADSSMLVQSLLDLIVDKAIEVVDEYQRKILKFEQKVLVRTSMKTVRNLHILSGDLTMHKQTLNPIKTLVYGLRRYDIDRSAALLDATGETEVHGYMSPKSKIYLADVHDHIDHVLNSMDMFASISENLIDYTFNMASYEMNGTMKRLMYVTVVFLPLTLLAGYFGMNFKKFWSINNNSDLFYWEIAIPMVIVVVLVFTCSDLGRLAHFVEKRWDARKVKKVSQSIDFEVF